MHVVSAVAKDKIADGLLADFVVTFPVLFYFIIVRPLKVPAKSLLLVVSLCCIAAYLILPQAQKQYILQIRKLTALAEILFIIYAVTKFKKIRAAYKINQAQLPDPVYNLRASMTGVLGELLAIKVLAAELAVLRYGLLFWKKEKQGLTTYRSFSTHKEYGYIALWCVFVVIMLVEVTAFHLLLMKWSNTAAIIVTVLSLYGVVFLVADLSAILKRKILINGEQIILRTGLRWRVNTTISNISSIKKITNDHHSETPYLKGGIIKNSGNLLITFIAPVQVDKLYGTSKETGVILMNIDDFEGFADAINGV